MIKGISLLLATLALVEVASAQIPSAQFKVRESGLFGLKGERFAKVELSSNNGELPLTDTSANSGEYYYFLFSAIGGWTLDADFVKEEIPKLTLAQNDQTFQIGWKSDLSADSASTSIIVGFPKDLKLYLPFIVQFVINKDSTKSEIIVPQEYWPGYTTLTEAFKEAEKAAGEKRYRDAIAKYEHLMQTDSLQVFPQFSELKDRRTHCFDGYVDETWSAFQTAARGATSTLKEKISQIDLLRPQFQFAVDSLPSPTFNVAAEEASVKVLLDRTNDAIVRLRVTRDSLQRVLDDQNVRWISEGAPTGKNGPQFEKIVEILAYAFSSLDFGDTTSRTPNFVLPPDLQSALVKNNLQESYNTFLRQAIERYQKREPFLPPNFLTNLRRDSTAFSLPFHSMLMAIQHYYNGAYPEALEAVRQVVKTCFDAELSRRFDQMRVFINLRMHPMQPEVMALIDEAFAAEKAGDKDLASDRYNAALKIAPDFAYPAYLCGRLFARNGDPIRARSFFERAYSIDSMYTSAYREAWSLCQSSGNYKAMIEVLTRALSRGNDSWETNLNLGIAHLGDGDLAKAIKQFERALDLSPNNYQTNVQLGLAHQGAKNFQKAREYFNKAIFIDPHRLEAVEALQKLDEAQRTSH
jgi:tetratricopeptide (TPR) repeat protein